MSNVPHSHQPPLIYTHEGDVPPVNQEQVEKAVRWSLSGLPHRVDYRDDGDVVIHLTSGRTVRITPVVQDSEDNVKLDIIVHEIEAADVPEMLAIHSNVVENTMFVAKVLWARQAAAA
jgi:hypothetical protein